MQISHVSPQGGITQKIEREEEQYAADKGRREQVVTETKLVIQISNGYIVL